MSSLWVTLQFLFWAISSHLHPLINRLWVILWWFNPSNASHNIPWPAVCEYKHCNIFCSRHFIAPCPMTNRLWVTLWCCVVGCLIISNQASGLGWSKWQVYRHILLLDKFVISWSWPTGCEQHTLFLLGILTSSYDLTNSLWVIK